MTVIYEARSMNIVEDYANEEEAVAFVERRGAGSITTFIRGSDGRDRSCRLIRYTDGEWIGIDISR